MAAEVKLEPGWLRKDVARASQRLDQWAPPAQSKEPANSASSAPTRNRGSREKATASGTFQKA